MNAGRGLTLLFLLCAAMFGCAPARVYHVQVNGYTESGGPMLTPGASLFVVDDPKAQNPLLEKEVKAKIEALLSKKGYLLVPYDRADYFVLFTYGLGSPQTMSVTAPTWGVGLGFGSGYCGPGVGYGVYWPGCGPFYTETRALYDRWLRVSVVNGNYYRATGKSRPVWLGEAHSTGTSSDIREVINPLLVAAFEQLGVNTGKACPAAINHNDPRITDLERVH
jgi:hypothetical protein|uniref:DUF4136 domain-containing protein n=1 Tax=Desulfobacca acetoxidans TaxID=60893 RepID=A0A7V6DQ59_9BACT